MNPLFKQYGNQNSGILQQFGQFMQQMQGNNPQAIIDSLVQSGKITQSQLNNVQAKAAEMRNVFAPFFKR